MVMNNSFEQVSVRLVKEAPLMSNNPLTSPEKIVKELGQEIFSLLDREEMAVINFDSKMKPINFNVASVGTINSSLAHPRELLKSSILSNAAFVVLMHNHPSGDLTPSKEDVEATEKLCKAFNMLDIQVLDHVIIGGREDNYFYSFKKEHIVDFKTMDNGDYGLMNFTPLADDIIKKINVIRFSDELTFWQNRNTYFPLSDAEAELLLDYEDMNKKTFVIDSNELKLLNNTTYKIEECNLETEILGVSDYIQDKIDTVKTEAKNTQNFVKHCSLMTELDELKEIDKVVQGLYSKTSVGKNFELGDYDNKGMTHMQTNPYAIMDFGNWFQDLLKKHSVKQKHLADMLGISFKTVNHWCRGSNYPSIEHHKKIEEVFLLEEGTIRNKMEEFKYKENSTTREETKPKNYTLVNDSSPSTLSKEETMDVLDRHFKDCLKYWERTLGVDSDLSKEAYEHAIEEIPTNNPFKMQGEKLNEEWVEEFRQSRLMDCYGKNIPRNMGGKKI